MEKQPARKKARLSIADFFVKADWPVDVGNERSASVNLLSIAEPKEELGPEPEERSETSSLSTKTTQTAHDYPVSWNAGQRNYFSRTYSWLFFSGGKVGCSFCKKYKISWCAMNGFNE